MGSALDTNEVFGFNTDVSYRSSTYHVQTENMADEASPTINTLIYLKGTLVRKISSSYADLPPDERHSHALEERVKQQHLAVLNRIKRGEFA